MHSRLLKYSTTTAASTLCSRKHRGERRILRDTHTCSNLGSVREWEDTAWDEMRGGRLTKRQTNGKKKKNDGHNCSLAAVISLALALALFTYCRCLDSFGFSKRGFGSLCIIWIPISHCTRFPKLKNYIAVIHRHKQILRFNTPVLPCLRLYLSDKRAMQWKSNAFRVSTCVFPFYQECFLFRLYFGLIRIVRSSQKYHLGIVYCRWHKGPARHRGLLDNTTPTIFRCAMSSAWNCSHPTKLLFTFM